MKPVTDLEADVQLAEEVRLLRRDLENAEFDVKQKEEALEIVSAEKEALWNLLHDEIDSAHNQIRNARDLMRVRERETQLDALL